MMCLEKPIINVIQNYVQEYHKHPLFIQIVKNMAILDKIPNISRHHRGQEISLLPPVLNKEEQEAVYGFSGDSRG